MEELKELLREARPEIVGGLVVAAVLAFVGALRVVWLFVLRRRSVTIHFRRLREQLLSFLRRFRSLNRIIVFKILGAPLICGLALAALAIAWWILGPCIIPRAPFNVYSDAGAEDNHFFSTGKMGDVGDVTVIEGWLDAPECGASSIRIVYDAQGQGDDEGHYRCRLGETTSGPCRWAGLYWLNPADNWGTVEDAGFNLGCFRKLTFWARTDTPPTMLRFRVGGVGREVPTPPPYPDSFPARESGWETLTEEWQQFEIDLTGADLSYVIGGFAWTTEWSINGINENNPRMLAFYLDDIRFER